MTQQCSTPGCTAEAVLQWQRHATQDETDAHIAGLEARFADMAAIRNARHLTHVAQLQARHDELDEIDHPDARRTQQLIAEQIKADTAAHEIEQHKPAPDLRSLHTPVTVAEFGCEDHQPADPTVTQPAPDGAAHGRS